MESLCLLAAQKYAPLVGFSTCSSDCDEPSPVTLNCDLNVSSMVGLLYRTYPMSFRLESPTGCWYHSIVSYELMEWEQLIVAGTRDVPNSEGGSWWTSVLRERPAFREKRREDADEDTEHFAWNEEPTGEEEEQQSGPMGASDHDVVTFLSLCIDCRTEEEVQDLLRGEEAWRRV